MTETSKNTAPRREFLKNTARLAAASALAGVAIPHVHAAEDNTIRLALIGCGGRGSGARRRHVGRRTGDGQRFRAKAKNASSAGPVKLVAMADLFQDRLDASHKALSKQFGDKVDVPKERQFLGFDAYRKAIDCLRPGDVALLTTHAGFRADAPGIRGARRASTCSWRRASPPIRAASSRSSARARRPRKRTSRSPPA